VIATLGVLTLNEFTPGLPPAILRIRQAADYLGVSRSFLYELFARGEISRIRLLEGHRHLARRPGRLGSRSSPSWLLKARHAGLIPRRYGGARRAHSMR